MAQDAIILIRENLFRGPLEGLGPENWDFFGPWNGHERSECHLGTKKSWQSVSFLGEYFLDNKEFIFFNWTFVEKLSYSFRIRSCSYPEWFFLDPYPDPAKIFGSDQITRIRIRRTDFGFSSPFLFALGCLSSPPNIPGASPYPGVPAPSATQHSLCQVGSRPLYSVFISKINELMSIFFYCLVAGWSRLWRQVCRSRSRTLSPRIPTGSAHRRSVFTYTILGDSS